MFGTVKRPAVGREIESKTEHTSGPATAGVLVSVTPPCAETGIGIECVGRSAELTTGSAIPTDYELEIETGNGNGTAGIDMRKPLTSSLSSPPPPVLAAGEA